MIAFGVHNRDSVVVVIIDICFVGDRCIYYYCVHNFITKLY